LTGVQVREYAFEIAERNQLHGFKAKARKAGQDWFKLFLKRNPEVTIRTPEATKDRLIGFNKPQVDRFFNCWEICCGHIILWQAESSIVISLVHRQSLPSYRRYIVTQKGSRRVPKVTIIAVPKEGVT